MTGIVIVIVIVVVVVIIQGKNARGKELNRSFVWIKQKTQLITQR